MARIDSTGTTIPRTDREPGRYGAGGPGRARPESARRPVQPKRRVPMRMSLTERKLAPELERYVSRSMPGCADISVIVNNLVAFGGFKTVGAARDALRWGSGPFVYTL